MNYSNGQLPRSALAPITLAVSGEQAYLRKDAAKSFMAMNAESEARFGITLRVSSARVAYRTLSEQKYFWNLYLLGRGNLAARPGNSNHGWGLAVDLATPQMRSVLDQIGAKYGWAKQWSDAPSEWWHIKWREGSYPAVHAVDRWEGFTSSEKRWIQEYDRLKATNKDADRRRVLRRVMTQQRKKIWQAAQDTGWNKANRKARYASLLARTK